MIRRSPVACIVWDKNSQSVHTMAPHNISIKLPMIKLVCPENLPRQQGLPNPGSWASACGAVTHSELINYNVELHDAANIMLMIKTPH